MAKLWLTLIFVGLATARTANAVAESHEDCVDSTCATVDVDLLQREFKVVGETARQKHVSDDDAEKKAQQTYGQAESVEVARRAVSSPFESFILPPPDDQTEAQPGHVTFSKNPFHAIRDSHALEEDFDLETFSKFGPSLGSPLDSRIKTQPEHTTPSRTLPQIIRDSRALQADAELDAIAPLEPPLDTGIKAPPQHVTPLETLPKGIRDSRALEADLELEMMKLRHAATSSSSGYMLGPEVLQGMAPNKARPQTDGDAHDNKREQAVRQPVALDESPRQAHTTSTIPKITNNSYYFAAQQGNSIFKDIALELGSHVCILIGVAMIYVLVCGKCGATVACCIDLKDGCRWCVADWWEANFNTKMLSIFAIFVTVEGFYLMVKYGYLGILVPDMHVALVALLFLLAVYFDLRGKILKEYKEAKDMVDDTVTMITGDLDFFDFDFPAFVNDSDDEDTKAQKGKDIMRSTLKKKASALRESHIAKIKQKPSSGFSAAPGNFRMC